MTQQTIILGEAITSGLDPKAHAILRSMAISLARTRIQDADFADLTDNTTGTPAAAFVDVPVPSAVFNASSAGGVQTTAFNTSMGKVENAGAVLVQSMNEVRAAVGLPLMTYAAGTVAAADTVPAQDLTATSASGTSSVDYQSVKAAIAVASANIGKLMTGFNQIRAALGFDKMSVSAYKGHFTNLALADIPTVVSDADGSDSIATAAGTAALAAIANNLATICRYWNYMFGQGAFASLTDSTGGTAATGLAANPIPAAADGAATTSSPKAGFDTQLALYNDGLCEVVTKMNEVRAYYGLSTYTDSTGGSPNATLASMSVNLSAVDGSSGSSAVEQVTARARMTSIKNAMSSLAVGINDLVGFVGLPSLTDALGGVASTTIPAIAATATGTSGAGATLLDADVDAWLVISRNNLSTLVAKLNAIVGQSGLINKQLTVVAG